ncbi:MAG TPA: DUF2914 domain-containing protein [Candidatus Binatia bacterium]|nr:DUF2914 domain-containing protein [Candidatus Binatia bacterium]
MVAARLHAALAKPFMPAVFFFGGVTWDTLTLTRIDLLLDNLILLLYLVLLGVFIVLTVRADMRTQPDPAGVEDAAGRPLLDRARPHFPHAIQFLLGGLFSAYAIFYSQSASFTGTAVFFGLLVALLVGNEFLHDRFSNLRLLVALYAVVCFGFFTFFLPVLTGFMNTIVFLLGAVLSVIVTQRVVELIYQGLPDRSRKEVTWAGLPGVAVIGLLVLFYFLNWIPPVPLSLKFGGVYHEVTRADGQYLLSYETGHWYRFWKRSDDPFSGEGPVSCFTAVFAPVNLSTTIVHRWQYRPPGRDFTTTDRLGIAITGGREGGFRGVTVKQRVTPGDWRVDVETADGRIIGRVNFRVEARESPDPPELETITY